MVKEVNNVIKKILIIMIIFQSMFVPISNGFTIDDIIEGGDKFLYEGEIAGDRQINHAELESSVKQLYNILLSIGVALSVIVGAILGIKFMMGSVEEQAKIKEMLAPYVIGCVVTFGAFGIWSIVIDLGQGTHTTVVYSCTECGADLSAWYLCETCEMGIMEEEKTDHIGHEVIRGYCPYCQVKK